MFRRELIFCATLLPSLLSGSLPSLFLEYKEEIEDYETSVDMFEICTDNAQTHTDCNTVIEFNLAALESSSVLYDSDSLVGGVNPEVLHLEYREEDRMTDIRSAVFSNGTDGTTAYFTYNATHVVGSVHRPDGITERIVSDVDNKELR